MRRIKYDLSGRYVAEVKRLWRSEEDMTRNPVVIESGYGDIEIKPICYEGHGCQGGIVVRDKKGEKLVEAELKGGKITWFLGDVVEENDIPTFIEWANFVLKVTSIIKPVVDLLPVENYMAHKWKVEITLYNRHYSIPEYARGKPEYTLTLELPE